MRIVDPHHHLWDRDLHPYPWLADPTVSGLVGDTTPLCRNYLLADFMADAASVELVKSVHLQAEIAHDLAVEETRWLQGIADAPGSGGFPHGIVAYADLVRSAGRRHPGGARRLRQHAAASARSSIATTIRAVNFVDRDYMREDRWQQGFAPAAGARPVVRHAALCAADGRGCRHRAPPSRHPDHHQPHRHAAGPRPRRSRGLAQRHARPRGVPQRRRQDLGPRHGRSSLDRGDRSGRSSSRRSTCSAPPAACSPATFRSTGSYSDYAKVWRAFDQITARLLRG